MNRREFHLAAMAAAASSLAVPQAHAQNRPTVKLQVGFTPGGATDILARAMATRLAVVLDQPVIVENRPGAGGRTVLTQVRRAPADGLTILLTPGTPFTLSPWLYSRGTLGYDPSKDFVQIAGVATMYFGVMINLREPSIKDFKTLVEYLKANPKHAAFASPGPGTVPHFVGEMLARELKLPLQHIGYKGTGPAMNDFLGNQFPMMVDTLWVDRHKSGQLKIVAVTGERRYRDLPDVPTLKELGVPLAVDQYYSVCAPAGTPEPALRRLDDALRETLKSTEVQDAFYAVGQIPTYISPSEVSAMQLAQYRHWEETVKLVGYVPE